MRVYACMRVRACARVRVCVPQPQARRQRVADEREAACADHLSARVQFRQRPMRVSCACAFRARFVRSCACGLTASSTFLKMSCPITFVEPAALPVDAHRTLPSCSPALCNEVQHSAGDGATGRITIHHVACFPR